jgi:endonuclease YncB( thermonuclease family)
MKLLVYFLILLVLPTTVSAHGGGLNKEGCHSNHKTGDYHCHRGPKNTSAKRSPSSLQESLTGIPTVTDGDTIRIGNTRIRLHGIDAPETNQICERNGKKWRCGREATKALRTVIGEKSVSCSKRDIDRYGRVVAVCRAGSINLNAWMVENGWAVAYRRYSRDYIADEQGAKASRHGMWSGKFIMPWDWRKEY